MISIRPVKSTREVLECIKDSLENYKDQESVIIVDPETATRNILTLYNQGCMFMVLIHNEKIISWIVAAIGPASLHSKEKALHQMYYHTIANGIIAYRSMCLAHKAMITYAAEKQIPIVKSNSYLPNYDVFTRILQKEGWVVSGAAAARRLTTSELARGAQEGPRLPVRCHAVAG